jgi:hypothetical protein
MEGADIYQIAKNCRTSVEMIEKFYAAHIKNTLDAAAINVMRPRRAPPATPSSEKNATVSGPAKVVPACAAQRASGRRSSKNSRPCGGGMTA